MKRALGRVMIVAASAALAACGGGGQRTALEVTDAQGQPVRGALVVTTALDSGFVPLPISDRTLEEISMLERRDGGMTDARGLIDVELFPNRAHLVEVTPPMWTEGEVRRATWWLSGDTRTLEPVEGENGLLVRVKR